MANLRVSLIQSTLYWENKTANLEMFGQKIEAIRENPELIVLPEMFNTGFSMNKELLAESMDGQAVSWMKKTAANKSAILAGSIIAKDPENPEYFNRLVWMLPNGESGFYNKRHLFAYGNEDQHYSRGHKKLIASVNGWRINLQVCYDLRFPVWLRQNPENERSDDPEYDLIVVVANWPVTRRHAWRTLLQARAIENQCFVVGVNRTGEDGKGLKYGGESMIIGPLGETLQELGSEEDTLSHTLDRQWLTEVRSKFPFWRDADTFNIQT